MSGVKMPAFGHSLSDAAQTFFDQLFSAASDINSVPRLLFVFKRTASVGLLFEGQKLTQGDLLDVEEIGTEEISVFEEVGAIAHKYSDGLRELCQSEFKDLVDHEFVFHQGVSTCLYACPPLGFYTHGYEPGAVEPVVRFFIGAMFQLIENGVKCTQDQAAFFQRYCDEWRNKGSKFVTFHQV